MEVQEAYGQQVLSEGIKENGLVKRVIFLENTDSTNVQAKSAAENGAPDGNLVVADAQTAGRGRRGRQWTSPAGKNIYFSLLLRPDFAPEKASMLTLVMALAVASGIEHAVQDLNNGSSRSVFHADNSGIKWPNDLVINGKKICGILTEMSLRQNAPYYVVIGVGINVYEQDFAPELVDKATTLETECGQKISRSSLLANVIEAFEEYYSVFKEEESLAKLKKQYHSLLVNRDRQVCVLEPKGEYQGIATGITDTGELCVKLEDGSETKVYAGEVSVRGIYGYV